jgi:hypothetical protein
MPVSFLGRRFQPDITVTTDQHYLIACEVKFLRDKGLQNAITTAVEQASLYRIAGYAEAVIVLIDVARDYASQASVDDARTLLRGTGLHLVHRHLRVAPS